MKKLMVSTIILLPLLILAIMLVSGAIMSIVTHIYVESVEFVQNDTLVLVLDDESAPPTSKCEVNILPLKASNRDITFGSDDESVVTIDENGVVTAKWFGETYVSVVSKENKAAEAKRKVLVTDNKVHALDIKAAEGDLVTEMYNGDTQRLVVSVMPQEAKDQSVTWSSSDPAVLSVSLSGELTCQAFTGDAPRTVTITATANADDTISDSIEVVCHRCIESIRVEGDLERKTIVEKETDFPAVIPTPSNATYTVSYKSSNEELATVDENGHITFTGAGSVSVTATASDVKGNTSNSVTVIIDCSDGYFIGSLFDKAEYYLDYDQYVNAANLDDVITLKHDPEGTYRLIKSVNYTGHRLLEFDMETEKFKLKNVGDSTPIGDVVVIINAVKYSEATHQLVEDGADQCTVHITRKARSISFIGPDGKTPSQSTNSNSVTFAEGGSVKSGIGVVVTPANHTDRLALSLADGGEYAEFDGSTLTFSKDGTASVKAYIAGNESVSNTFTLSYTEPKLGDIEVSVGGDNPAPKNVVLNYRSESNKEECVLEITPPAGMKAQYISESPDIADFDNADVARLTPKKGGYATIRVTFVPETTALARTADDASSDITFTVYVDRPIGASDVTIKFDIDTESKQYSVTQNASIGYTVSLSEAITPDVLVGKVIKVDGQVVSFFDGDSRKEYKGSYSFPTHSTDADDKHDIAVNVSYDETAWGYVREEETDDAPKTQQIFNKTRLAETTRGTLRSVPKVTLGASQDAFKASGNAIAFSDIGDELTLNIEVVLDADRVENPDPIDFELTKQMIAFACSKEPNYIGAAINVTDKAHATVTLTEKEVYDATKDSCTLSVAGNNFGIDATLCSLADKVELFFGGELLDGAVTYETLLRNLTFKARISRSDGRTVTDRTASYSTVVENGSQSIKLNNSEGQIEGEFKLENVSGQFTITVTTGTKGTASVTINRRALSTLDYKQYYVEYPNGGSFTTLDTVEFANSEVQNISLPSNHQGVINVCIEIPSLDGEHVLGGLDITAEDAELKTLLVAKCPNEDQWGYNLTLSGNTAKCEIHCPTGIFASKQVVVNCGNKKATLSLSCVKVVRIEFKGFDSKNKANGGDVYKGYQQVRVFAKHSDYGKDGGIVDYVRMPVSAIGDTVFNTPVDPATLTWTLAKYDDSNTPGAHEELVSQKGNEITYNGKKYTLENSTLTENDTQTVIAQNGVYKVSGDARVPFIDAHADGYADIYFGNFVGLEEVDVQNDYFGNFGEQENWKKVNQTAEDNSGRTFAPSNGAFKYLRVMASDGAGDAGVNAYFNFNVLQDDALVNVFNATGYYNAGSKIVLQHNLYGQGELSEQPELDAEAQSNDWYLDSSFGLGKDVLYGNGNQVNLQALNEALRKEFPDKLNESKDVNIANIYNATIKGQNPETTINGMRQKIVFYMKYAYYCDLSYYFKGRPISTAYIKNTVLHASPKSALQLFYSGEKAYFENTTIVECGAGITNENASPAADHETNFYFKGNFDVLNYTNIKGVAKMASDAVTEGQLGLLSGALTSVTQHFEWFGKKCTAAQTESFDMPLFNLVIYTSNKKGVFNFWNGTGYDKPKDDIWYKCSNCGAVKAASSPPAFCEGCFRGQMKPAYNYSYGTPEGGSPMKMVLDLSDYKGYLGNAEVTAWTYNYPRDTKFRLPGMTYDYTVSVDGRNTPQSLGYNFNQYFQLMFTEERNIRLLCQYVNVVDGNLVKNEEHILWHMQQAYRDKSLIMSRINNHIQALRASLTGKNITWPDGTTPEQAMQEYDEYQAQKAVQTAQAASNLLATALIPSKQSYSA